MKDLQKYLTEQLENKLDQIDEQLANNGIPNEITLGEATAYRKVLKYMRTHSTKIDITK